MRVFLIFVPFLAIAGFSSLDKSSRYRYQQSFKKEIAQTSVEKYLQKIQQQDQKIAKILQQQERTLIVKKSVQKVAALSRFRGILLNSVIATNTRPSKFIVRIREGELGGSELRCSGVSFQRRVPSHCDLLVMDSGEHQVDVEIWGMDGAQGITSDYYYSGEERAFVSSSFASFWQAILSASKERIVTPFGESTRNNAKNTLLSGLSGIGENAREKIAESNGEKLSIAYVNAGKEILIFFNQALSLKGDRK